MRRAQSVRTYPRTSLTLGSSIDHADLSTLRETSEPPSVEDTLRKQLLDKDRENDKVSPRLRPYLSFVVVVAHARSRAATPSSNPPSLPSKPNSPPVPPSKPSSPSKKNTKT